MYVYGKLLHMYNAVMECTYVELLVKFCFIFVSLHVYLKYFVIYFEGRLSL